MALIDDQVRAIAGAQFRVIYNRMTAGGGGAGRVLYWLSVAVWYGGVALLSWLAAETLPALATRETLVAVTSMILLGAMAFWQLTPVMMAASGLSLDLKRLLVYPVTPRKLFAVEALLRASTGTEVLIVLVGVGAGLMRSPLTPGWTAVFLLCFVAMNLMLSVGIRDLLTRMLARRGVRELVVLAIVMAAALPQVVAVAVPAAEIRGIYQRYTAWLPHLPLPWATVALLSAGAFSAKAFLVTAGWILAAGWFGYTQFQRGLRWDAAEVESKEREKGRKSVWQWVEWIYELPGRAAPDPMGALITKELRTLGRSTRFRLMFFMGFTFGILIWLPLAMKGPGAGGRTSENLLLWVSLYAALLLGEALFWNTLGFDRAAVQAYYVMPVRLRTVLAAKNVTAVLVLLAEIVMVTAALAVLRIRFPVEKIPEAFACTMLLAVFLLALGNVTSVKAPRGMDPASSWRQASAGRLQGLMLLLYPLLLAPIGLAYLARYAFERDAAFYLVLASGYVVAGMTYWVALDSAVEIAEKERERIVTALSAQQGPVA
jgi:ABC-2 type transport system permease protein